MDIKPIRNDKAHRAVLAEIEALWGAKAGTERGDRLDVLLALADAYEAKRWPLEPDERFDPVDVLHYVIDELGHTQAELAAVLGSRPRASEILARRRPLTIEMIRAIHDAWRLPVELLIQPYEIAHEQKTKRRTESRRPQRDNRARRQARA